MDSLICVIRTPTGLKAKVSRYQSKFAPPDSEAPAWQNRLKRLKVSSTYFAVCR